MNALLILNVVALALFAWVMLVKVVPSCATSLYRYRLWQLRDQLVDDIRHSQFESTEQPRRIVALLEVAIRAAPDLSPLNVGLFQLFSCDPESPDPLRLDDLAPRDRQALETCFDRFERATLVKMFAGTPSGWIVSVLVLPLFIVFVTLSEPLPSHRDERTRKRQQLKEEWIEDPALALMRKRSGQPQPHSLYQYV